MLSGSREVSVPRVLTSENLKERRKSFFFCRLGAALQLETMWLWLSDFCAVSGLTFEWNVSTVKRGATDTRSMPNVFCSLPPFTGKIHHLRLRFLASVTTVSWQSVCWHSCSQQSQSANNDKHTQWIQCSHNNKWAFQQHIFFNRATQCICHTSVSHKWSLCNMRYYMASKVYFLCRRGRGDFVKRDSFRKQDGG